MIEKRKLVKVLRQHIGCQPAETLEKAQARWLEQHIQDKRQKKSFAKYIFIVAWQPSHIIAVLAVRSCSTRTW